MNKVIDARGLSCPQPVILTKRAMDEGAFAHLTTIVDREDARENVSRLAKSQGYNFTIEQQGQEYHIHMYKANQHEGETQIENKTGNTEGGQEIVILIKSNLFGEGDPNLGQILMKSFLYTLNELEANLKTLIFMNSGVMLTVEGSPILEHLQALEQKGIEVLSCGTCLDYYKKKELLKAGQITNMYTALEIMTSAAKTITI